MGDREAAIRALGGANRDVRAALDEVHDYRVNDR